MTSQSKAFLWVVGVFLTGAVCGGAISFFAVRSPLPPPPEPDLLSVSEPVAGGPVAGEEPPGGPPVEPGEGPRGFGQRPGGPPGRGSGEGRGPAREMRRLAQLLQLTPEQNGQLREILAQSMQRFQAAQKDHRIRQHQIRSDMMHSLRNILTPEQKERLDGFLSDRRQRWRQQQDSRRGNPPGR